MWTLYCPIVTFNCRFNFPYVIMQSWFYWIAKSLLQTLENILRIRAVVLEIQFLRDLQNVVMRVSCCGVFKIKCVVLRYALFIIINFVWFL